MSHKKVSLYFDEPYAGFDAELYENDSYKVCLTEYAENVEKTTNDHIVIEPKIATEVYLGQDEIKSIINSLQFLLKEDEET